MKFYPVKSSIPNEAALKEEYDAAHEVGILRVGLTILFFRVRLRTYYIPFSDITRAFRRVMEVPAKMCCGRGNFAMENLVVCDDEKELAVIGLPGTKAARLLMEELREKMPDVIFSAPKKEEAQ